MSFLEINLADVKEPEYAPEGDGYPLIVAKSTLEENKQKTGYNVRLYILFDGMPDYQGINHYLSLPNDSDEDSTKQLKLLMIKRFLVAFDVPHDGHGFDPENIAGCMWENGTVKVKEYEGRLSNELNLPPLADEE